MGPGQSEVPASTAAALTGTYRSTELQTTLVVRMDGGELQLGPPGGNPLSLKMRGELFVGPRGLSLQFIRGGGKAEGFRLSVPRARNIWFERARDG